MLVTDLSPFTQPPSGQGQHVGASCSLPAKAQHPPEPGLLQVPMLSPRGALAPHRQAVEQGCVFSLCSWKEAPAVTCRPSHAPHGALQTTRQFINAAPQIRRFVRHGEAKIAGPVPDPRRVGAPHRARVSSRGWAPPDCCSRRVSEQPPRPQGCTQEARKAPSLSTASPLTPLSRDPQRCYP